MKRITLTLTLAAIALMNSVNAFAKYHSVTVHLKDRTTVQVNLSDDFTVRFNDVEMTLRGSSLENTVTIPKENIDRFEHSTGTAAITDADADGLKPVFIAGAMVFGNLPAGSSVQVFDASGRNLVNDTAADRYTLDFARFAPGIYLVKVNNNSYKIAVK